MPVYIVLKNRVLIIRFTITIVYLNLFSKVINLLFLYHISAKMKIKKVKKSNTYNIIYNENISSPIISALIKSFFLAH